MKKILSFLLVLCLFVSCVFGLIACTDKTDIKGNNNGGGATNTTETTDTDETLDDNEVKDIETDTTEHTFVLTSVDNGTYLYTCTDEDCNEEISFTITCSSGTDDCVTVDGTTITFGAITEKSVYSISGEFYGNIVIDVGEDYKFELDLEGFTITSYSECPIAILSGDKVTLSAKKETENYIYDLREEVGDEGYSGSVYALCDLDIQGKGALYVKSENNNGIHTKDDLTVKNLTLQVDCIDNALKGNDSVTIQSGNITLIARAGDGIKTSNSDISSKGNQRGTVTINGGNILIYAACDGIDAAYDVVIDESVATVDIQIYTDKYSKYSEEVTSVQSGTYYIRYNSTAYKYSILFYNSDTDYVYVNSSSYKTVSTGKGTYYYYPITAKSGYSKVKLFIYSSSEEQGQSEDYVACSEYMTLNSSYDTIALNNRNGSLSLSWTNYTTTNNQDFGGMQEGNTDKGDYSTKGIKADNQITISAGTIFIQAYDDAIHANNDNELENGETPVGDITILGGTITLYSNDDGIHADGTLSISDGTVTVNKSYEGLEGGFINISGGTVSVISSDDGLNAKTTSSEGIVISGGTVYVYAGGDGLDSNSKTSYSGIVISGGKTVVISTSGGNSCIDAEYGYKYTGGTLIAVCPTGMTQEVTRYNKTTGYAVTKSNFSLSANSYLVVSGVVTVKMPKSISSAFAIYLGETNGAITTASSTSYTLDTNGVYWN